MSKVWLVTGSASGLGRHIAEAVLVSGDRLVAAARDPRRLEALVEKYPDQVRTAALDVVDEDAARAAATAKALKLLWGSDAVQYVGQAEAARAADADRWRTISVSTDVSASGPIPAL